jgi:predicted transglutaminase-like cysteine proteinase
MQAGPTRRLAFGALAAMFVAVTSPVHAGSDRHLFASVGDIARAPVGWTEFCLDQPADCAVEHGAPRDVVLSGKAWRDLVRINKWVNETVRPMTDLEHHGVVEKWTYPNDRYGDCEDYVLLKRRLLVEAGWPREALLITVVRDHAGEGHAVLTVKSDRGEYILDNQVAAIELWSETGYQFVKRQSQSSPNVWVSLGDTRPAPPATSR